ncbi:MAG TPA: nucleotidyltransferase domain-containing protein [Verrucomicrobiae bacterium]|nr:nucleotidyltransferase domain-containing protein [Verrucomicrobiae bacterium]
MDTRTWMRYWRRAVFVAAVLRCVPFVRMVGLNGSMVTGTFRQQSDIDVYIVTKTGHIFLSRFLVTAVVALLGLKIRPNKEAGMICANRFAIEDFVEITPHDSYHARVFHNLIPLFVDGRAYQAFRAENQWMHEFGERLPLHQPALSRGMLSFLLQRLGELLLWWPALERWAERVQRARVSSDVRARHPESKVVISSKELRFHLPKKSHG